MEKLFEGEYRLAEIIWEQEPIPSGKLVTLAEERLGWKKSTTYTVLRKLVQKGIVKNESAVVSALIKQEEAQQAQSDALIERSFGGSLPRFLAAFLDGKRLSCQEAEELRALIDRYEEGER